VDYKKSLIIRLILALIIALIGNKLFYFVLFKPTFYFSYILLLKYNPVILNTSFLINGYNLNFVPACLALSAYSLLAVLILLTKDISIKKSIKIFITGSLVIFTVNIIRIFILALILIELDIKLFNNLHLFLWQILSTLFVVILWVYLTKLYKVKTIPVYSDFKELSNKIK